MKDFKNDDAMRYYDTVTEIYAFNVKKYNEKGNILRESGKFRESIKSYDRVIEIDPKNVIAWHNKGLAFMNLSKYDEAIQSFDRVLEIENKILMHLMLKVKRFSSYINTMRLLNGLC